MAEHRTGAQAVERALAVLDCFATSDGDNGVSDIAALTGLSISTTHRLMRALLRAGLLAQDDRTERYHLGVVLVALGRRAEAHLGFDRLLPHLQALATRTGESVNLGTRVGDEILIGVHVASSQPLRFDQPAGQRVAVHASAMGKALLAFAADPEAEVAALGDLARFTGSTLTTTQALLADLTETRARGWSMNDGERDPGVRTIGAPLLDVDGRPIAAVAVQGPALRLADARLHELADDLVAATSAMRRKM